MIYSGYRCCSNFAHIGINLKIKHSVQVKPFKIILLFFRKGGNIPQYTLKSCCFGDDQVTVAFFPGTFRQPLSKAAGNAADDSYGDSDLMGHTRSKPAEGRKLFMLNRFFLYAGQAVEGFIELSVKPLYFLIFFPEILRKQPQRKRQEGR